MNPTLPSLQTLRLVAPEITLVLAMCAVILVPFIKRTSLAIPTLTAVAGLLVALLCAISTSSENQSIFSGSLAIDPFSQFFKVMLLTFVILLIALWYTASRQATEPFDLPDLLCLLLGATFGMSLMASASNLPMIFIATESASLPSYVLAGFRKRHRVGSEGALKYVVFGSASSAVMLYGMSLLYGLTGSLDLAAVAQHAVSNMSPLLAVGILAMFAGIAFKLSAVPFHFWCPDVFQGAPVEVTTFLSVASKGAAVCLLLRVNHAFGAAAFSLGSSGAAITGLAVAIAILGAVTVTWGNLVAIHQTNIKRLLAYSSIAHAGYMILAASLMTTAQPGEPSRAIAGACLFYIQVYIFMNLGAFTVAGLINLNTGSEDIRDYAGLIRRSPTLAILLTLFLLSLFGMPGLGGFMGKVYLMKTMADSGPTGFYLIAVLLLNTLISLYFYLKPVYYMVFVPDRRNRPAFSPTGLGFFITIICAAVLLWTGLLRGATARMAHDHATIHFNKIAYSQAPLHGQADTTSINSLGASGAQALSKSGSFSKQ